MTKILYVENDIELTESFNEVVNEKKTEWQMDIVRHMQDAKQKIKTENDYGAYIIDVMLPRDEGELSKLETLELERLNLLDELTSIRIQAESDREKIFRLRKEIELLDFDIDKVLDKEGGIELLINICQVREDGIKNSKLHLPIIFWTARAAPELMEKCETLVHDDYLCWIEKPENEEDVLQTIEDLLEMAQKNG